MSNNLNGPRIADNQITGHHRTANDMVERLDSAITAEYLVRVTDTNIYNMGAAELFSAFRFVLAEGTPAADAPFDIVIQSGLAPRGLMFWRNPLTYYAAVYVDGQTDGVLIPPGGTALIEHDGDLVRSAIYSQPFFMTVAASDETTAITTGTSKVTFRMPRRVFIDEVRASLSTAQTSGSIVTVGINVNGTPLLTDQLTIDNTEKTSLTATDPAVTDDAQINIDDDAEITIDIDQVGDGTAKGLKVTFIGISY